MSRVVLFSAPYMLPRLHHFQPLLESYQLKVLPVQVQERLSEEQLLSFAGHYDATICGDDRYTARVLEACAPRLKVISKWGSGVDSIDQKAAERLGVRVCRTPNAFTLPVADTVLGYILAFARRQPWLDRAMKAGRWEKLPGRSLSECTLGVIGVGNIGKAVIRRAHAFGMRILGNDIAEIAPDFIAEYRVEMTSLEELLQRSDFVSLNCDLNPTSYHLINAETLRLMKPTAILINTARGAVVDEHALIHALQTGQIAGAALDVFESEPLPLDSPLLKMDQVMLAPHNANSSPSAWERVHRNTLRNLLQGLEIPCEDLEERYLRFTSNSGQ
ncbi:MAG: phosphoglycerate dehydrogenase [Anaerolineales bacterium]|nr:phosphoglycerate dehydrogenase [Anaerolineales bacterium]MCS7248415.1 phosphoglycerate dehydrogenase [Anaerolineales bacterium]MDW8162228.1 phosphoglycerate dehydrogenase [Anaerolineales bacterium]MDW8446385.1 phosphoglycerate dehydrogenase [Anaerolineales bacterium]